MTETTDPAASNSTRRKFLDRLKVAAAKAVAEGDPWAKYNLQSIPAERVIR